MPDVVHFPNRFPKYKCHKIVQASLINATLNFTKKGGELVTGHGNVLVTRDWVQRHAPDHTPFSLVGGYIVFYRGDDVYTSWSPRDAFEAGYNEVEEVTL